MSNERSAVSMTSISRPAHGGGPAPLAPSLHPDHMHLDSLISSGIVTHLVAVNEEIDPLFVVAQIRELPEVDFVAAFQNGLIAFGCTEGLPHVLASIAQPAYVTESGSQPAPTDPMMERLIVLEETIATLMLKAAPDRRIAEIRDEIGALNTRLAESTSAEQLQRITATITTMREEMRAPLPPMQDARVDQLQEQVLDLSTQQKRDWGADQLREIMAAIAAIREEIRNTPAGEIALSKEASDQGVAVLSMLVKRVEAVAQQVTARALPDDPTVELAALQDRVDQLNLSVARTNKSEERNSEKTQRLLQDMSTTLGRQSTGKSDVSDLERQMKQLQRQNSEVFETLLAQQKVIKELAQRPLPEVDLTEQRADFARFGAEFSASIDRLESSARELAAQARMPSPQMDQVLAAVARVPQVTHDTIAKTVDLAAMDQEVADMRASLNTLPERLGMSGIERKVNELSQRSDPATALNAQHQHFTRFGNSISGVKERLDAMAQTLSAVRYERAELDNLAEAATRIETQMQQISQDHKKAQEGLSEDIRDLSALHFPKSAPHTPAKRHSNDSFEDMISGRIRSNGDAMGTGLSKHAVNMKES